MASRHTQSSLAKVTEKFTQSEPSNGTPSMVSTHTVPNPKHLEKTDKCIHKVVKSIRGNIRITGHVKSSDLKSFHPFIRLPCEIQLSILERTLTSTAPILNPVPNWCMCRGPQELSTVRATACCGRSKECSVRPGLSAHIHTHIHNGGHHSQEERYLLHVKSILRTCKMFRKEGIKFLLNNLAVVFIQHINSTYHDLNINRQVWFSTYIKRSDLAYVNLRYVEIRWICVAWTRSEDFKYAIKQATAFPRVEMLTIDFVGAWCIQPFLMVCEDRPSWPWRVDGLNRIKELVVRGLSKEQLNTPVVEELRAYVAPGGRFGTTTSHFHRVDGIGSWDYYSRRGYWQYETPSAPPLAPIRWSDYKSLPAGPIDWTTKPFASVLKA